LWPGRTGLQRRLRRRLTGRLGGGCGREAAAIVEDEQVSTDTLVLGRYRLLRRLGAGAFGSVWAARDERLERDVAVKILERARIVGGRFEREARAAARLQHPAIVTLYEAGIDEHGAYLVCELVRGSTLERLIADGRLSDRHILQIGLALCDALDHAHAAGVIHRDVKPSNVLVPGRPAAETPAAKLTDFGVAHVVGGDSLTRTGEIIGTDAYMAPEQARGREAGPQADLYSLAVVLYEALSGVNPLRERRGKRAAGMADIRLPPLRRQRRDLPRELAAALDLALRPRAQERGTVAGLREALERSLGQVGDRRGTVAPPLALPTLSVAPTRPLPHDPRSRPRSVPLALAARGARAPAALAAAIAVAWLRAPLGVRAPAAALALAAAAAVLLAPRLGWIAVVVMLVGVGAAAGHAGGALLVAAVGLAPALLIWRRGGLWSVSAAALGLGLIGLGGAWPAVAATVRGVWARAALGALGWLWLCCAAALAGGQMYVRDPPGVPPPGAFSGSLAVALHRTIVHLAAPGAMAGAAAWALGAATAPLVWRGRSRAAQLTAAAAWTSALTLATLALSGPGDGPTVVAAALGALGGLAALMAGALCRGARTPTLADGTTARVA